MSFEIVFSEGAEKDFDEITKWYKEIRRGLDLDFILCLENELETIKREPRLFKEIKKNVRKTATHRFPYQLYYTIEDKQIVILAILHYKRSKRTLNKKLKRK